MSGNDNSIINSVVSIAIIQKFSACLYMYESTGRAIALTTDSALVLAFELPNV